MRVLVAGGGGVISRRLITLLVESGHEVIATTRSEQKHPELARSAGSRYRSLPGASWVLLAAGGLLESADPGYSRSS